jgi:hypothetical protein
MTPVARGNESGYLQTLYFPKTHSPLAPAAEQSREFNLALHDDGAGFLLDAN